jgi:hypothetical protein
VQMSIRHELPWLISNFYHDLVENQVLGLQSRTLIRNAEVAYRNSMKAQNVQGMATEAPKT